MQSKKEEMPYRLVSLNNGLRVVTKEIQGLVSYIGVLVNVGSRDEDKDHEGLAHFVEHTLFKGTDKRRSWQISSRMESVGGELNAYTSKEETMVYTVAPAGYEDRALELLADLVTSSRFPENEIDKERDVIIEEIYSYLDSPSERIFDEYEELAYKGSGLAHNILGTPESVKGITGKDCRGLLDRYYVAGNMVIYCVTPCHDNVILKKVEKYFGPLPAVSATHHRSAPPSGEFFDEKRDYSNHQANTIMGARTFGRNNSDRFALYLLNNYLAGPCLNSLLHRELREKRGYVYNIDSNVSLLSDTGLLSIYFGCDPRNVEKCRKIIIHELETLSSKALSAHSFERIKKQYCGQLVTSSDNIENRAMSLGKSVLYYGKVNDISTTIERIKDVTAEEMRRVAESIFKEGLSTLTLV